MDRLEEIKQWAEKYGHGRADTNGTEWLISEIESLRQSLESIALALDGLPITGERTGPHSAKYLDFADQIKALRQQLADSQEHAQAEQNRANSHWAKIENWQDKVRELRVQLAETHRLWQESCSDAFEKSKQLAAKHVAFKEERNHCLDTAKELASANDTICEMREALQKIQLNLRAETFDGENVGIFKAAWERICILSTQTLSSSPTCIHSRSKPNER